MLPSVRAVSKRFFFVKLCLFGRNGIPSRVHITFAFQKRSQRGIVYFVLLLSQIVTKHANNGVEIPQ